MHDTVKREVAGGGRVTLSDSRCTFVYEEVRPGVLEIRIAGTDNGQFGTAPLDEIAMALVRARPIELFVDAADASMPNYFPSM